MRACGSRSEAVDELMVSTVLMHELFRAVEVGGVPAERFARAAELDAFRGLPDGSRVPVSALFRACETAVLLTGDPAFGLHWGERLSRSAFNVVSHLLTHAPSLGQAFDALRQVGELVADSIEVELVERDGRAVFVYTEACTPPPPVRRVIADMVMVSMLRLAQQYGGPRMCGHSVCFTFAAPAYRAEYTRIFGTAVHFDQPFTGLVLPKRMLGSPSVNTDEELYATLLSLAERRLLRLSRRLPYALRVRQQLTREAHPHRVPMEQLARRLGVSVRSLHRRLKDENQSYPSLVGEVCAQRAKHLLGHERLAIKEVAHDMGFASVSSFHRAFQRWTGQTPGRFQSL